MTVPVARGASDPLPVTGFADGELFMKRTPRVAPTKADPEAPARTPSGGGFRLSTPLFRHRQTSAITRVGSPVIWFPDKEFEFFSGSRPEPPP